MESCGFFGLVFVQSAFMGKGNKEHTFPSPQESAYCHHRPIDISFMLHTQFIK
jgi:hypothetical protein